MAQNNPFSGGSGGDGGGDGRAAYYDAYAPDAMEPSDETGGGSEYDPVQGPGIGTHPGEPTETPTDTGGGFEPVPTPPSSDDGGGADRSDVLDAVSDRVDRDRADAILDDLLEKGELYRSEGDALRST